MLPLTFHRPVPATVASPFAGIRQGGTDRSVEEKTGQEFQRHSGCSGGAREGKGIILSRRIAGFSARDPTFLMLNS